MEEQFFSIKDQGMIFDILRNKMYSNPILAICREISCNARDAHREVGTPEVPIHIHLPNNLEQYYKIKDFGPGISPDRMLNIFIQYTASTKRNDNLQTGGFGLGAKTPFSYSDSFSIVTNHNGTQYNYGCAIDETKVGKMALLSKSPTKEPNGTEIIIPVKPVDFRAFADWTEQATRHFEVKPVIKGGAIKWQEINKVLEGSHWAISASAVWQRAAKLVIDGIEYPLELEALRKYADSKLVDAARGNLILYFGVGELSLSASRENVYLDKPTQEKIRQRLDEVVAEIKQRVDDKIANFPNLWDANLYYRKDLTQAFSNIGFLGNLAWQGISLQPNSYLHLGCPVFRFTKGKYSRKYGTDPNKLTRFGGKEFSFEENAALFINDLPLKEPTPRHVKKAFDDDPKLQNVFIICPTDVITQDSLNKSIHLDKMGAQLLSTITKATGRAYTPATSRLLVFKFDTGAAAFKQVSYSSLEEDANTKVLCLLSKESYPSSRQLILKNNKNISLSAMKTMCDKFPGTSFYGVDSAVPADRIEEDFSDFGDIEEFIDEKILSNTSINYVEIKFATSHNYHVDEKMLKNYAKLKSMIADPNSFFLKRLELHNKIKQLCECESDLGLLYIYESVHGNVESSDIEKFVKDNPDQDLEKVNTLFGQKYPLLAHVNSYKYHQIVNHIADYVNLIDKV